MKTQILIIINYSHTAEASNLSDLKKIIFWEYDLICKELRIKNN
jgi:hypothetical protein